MIIAIPVDENKVSVCVSFGRAPYFMIHDTESEKTEIVENLAASAQGGAGIKAAQLVADRKTDALITVRCGENAAEVFKTAGIKMYQADGTDAKQNIDALKNGKLVPLTSFHAGFHGRQ
ncbi:MAG: NifB/NifX family molybdenum-iron cluster-binding protein [Christensenellales bacterium]|jgi:predicted Fe-Mo cluster-binding NifX family protein